MSIVILMANILCLLAFVAHTFIGDRELHLIEPTAEGRTLDQREKWTMARAGWHLYSVDLLFASIILAIINFSDYLTAEQLILQLMAAYFLAYGIAWLFIIALSKSFPKKYIKLGQWVLLFAISGLLFWASTTY